MKTKPFVSHLATRMLRESSSPVSSPSLHVGSKTRTLPEIKIPAMAPSVFTLSEDLDADGWTTVRHKRRTVRLGSVKSVRSSAQAPARLPRPPFMADRVVFAKNSNFRNRQGRSGHKAQWMCRADSRLVAHSHLDLRQKNKRNKAS